MTNREKLLTEISQLTDVQLMDLMMVGYSGISPTVGNFGLLACPECRSGRPECDQCTADWMRQECTRDRLTEVGS